jgi:hypothetical protein
MGNSGGGRSNLLRTSDHPQEISSKVGEKKAIEDVLAPAQRQEIQSI